MSSNTYCDFWKRESSDEEDDKDNTAESHQRQDSSGVFSNQFRIIEIQKKRWDALIYQIEKLWESENARRDAVLERLRCLAKEFVPSPHLQTDPRNRPESSAPGQRIKAVPSLLSVDEKVVSNNWTTQTQRLQQSQKTQDEGKQKVAVNRNRRSRPSASITSEHSLSSLNTHNTSELRASPLGNTTPSSPSAPQCQSRSRLPVMLVHPNGQDKEVGGRYRLQTVRGQVEEVQESLQHLYEDSDVHLPQPPAATRKTHMPVMKHVTPVPPPQPSPFSKRQTRHGRFLHPSQIVNRSKKTENTHNVQRADSKTLEKLQPLPNPVGSLSLCLKMLSSVDWEKKMEGLRSVQALAQHHPDKLMENLYEVCPAVIAEVKNLHSTVACAAMDTIVYLSVYLQRDMDSQVERAGCALLLKIAQSSANFFIRTKVNRALEALVQNCSPGRVLNVLVNTGQCHLSAAVRASTAQHLHLLADILGSEAILSARKSFTERFVTAVSKMSLDAAAEVRPHGHAIFQQLAPYSDFMKLWYKTIEEKDHRPLKRIMRNATQLS